MACEEKGVAYELKPLSPHCPEVNAIHPFGRIPAMRHGDFELCESKAIATYVDLAFPGPRLFPTAAREVALAEQWVSLVNTKMDHTLVRTYLFAYIFPNTADGSPNRAAIEGVKAELQAHVQLLDRAVSRTGYLAGGSLSFADLNVMPILFYLQKFPEGSAAMAAAPRLAEFYERLSARPSFRNTMPPPPPPRQSTPGAG